jgi:hypothetical protein
MEEPGMKIGGLEIRTHTKHGAEFEEIIYCRQCREEGCVCPIDLCRKHPDKQPANGLMP